ncbi:MAG: hypothetical protein JF597_02260 [Streptomyces sp.]|uniref:hypothetical protein n=1 Tax=Streptomyces sp. TaxID=1931 RepID=UPI0025DF5C8E|nr:hypothetical protein [Streptomyces sp.]MBW8792449.1 hypothetical protein [Streptomyces sp.]
MVRCYEPTAERFRLRRVAQGTYAAGGGAEPAVKVQELNSCPDRSPVARSRATALTLQRSLLHGAPPSSPPWDRQQ